MPSGSFNQPKLLRGAFVDSNLLAFPPLIVPFQFNPERMTRRKTVQVRVPKSRAGRQERVPSSDSMGEAQSTLTSPEMLSFDIRLDATDAMEGADGVAGEFGVLPALSALEMMVTPRAESFFGGLLGMSADFGFGDRRSTPVLIFVWGRQRIYPVRLTELNIQETEYNPNLNPTRVTASVSVQVISGDNPFYLFTEAQREILAALNLANAGNLARSIVNVG
jgi:Contractile injection system tube protein